METLQGLYLNTERGGQRGPSGYKRLTEAFPGSAVVEYPRVDPKTLPARIWNRIIRTGAATRYIRWGSLRCEWEARRRCRRGRVDFIHLLWGDHDWGFLDKLVPAGIPLIATFHQPVSILSEALLHPRRLQRFSRLILMSPEQAGYLNQAGGIPMERMVFVPHGIDCAAFRPGAESGPPNEKRPFRLLHVGNYLRNFALLEQVAIRLAENPLVELRVIAPPGRKSEFPGLAGSRFESNLSSEALLRAYQEADCLLMTVEDATANNAILEAMACGKPVVCEESASIREYTGPDAAIFTAGNDPEAMLRAVRELASDPERAQRMGRAARVRAEELDWSRICQRLEVLYREVMEEAK